MSHNRSTLTLTVLGTIPDDARGCLILRPWRTQPNHSTPTQVTQLRRRPLGRLSMLSVSTLSTLKMHSPPSGGGRKRFELHAKTKTFQSARHVSSARRSLNCCRSSLIVPNERTCLCARLPLSGTREHAAISLFWMSKPQQPDAPRPKAHLCSDLRTRERGVRWVIRICSTCCRPPRRNIQRCLPPPTPNSRRTLRHQEKCAHCAPARPRQPAYPAQSNFHFRWSASKRQILWTGQCTRVGGPG